MFAQAREAAGTASDEIDAQNVGQLLEAAGARYGARFIAVLAISAVWLNGEPAGPDDPLTAHDEVAVLPPVSGGA